MLEMLRRRAISGPRDRPSTDPDCRIYAIGDVHGRVDLLGRLLHTIERDNEVRPPRQVAIVLIGDLIDRHPDAAALLATLAADTPAGLICLLGNHEAALIDAFDGDLDALSLWYDHGGRDTLIGFGAAPEMLDRIRGKPLLALVHALIPTRCIDWLRGLPVNWCNGDYFFVHAGIRPGRALTRQTREDMLWIRHEFLVDRRWHGKVVVHGHTPSDTVELADNRIGIDTGAYSSGRLSAVGLQDDERWLLQS